MQGSQGGVRPLDCKSLLRGIACSRAIPAMQEEAAALIAGLVFADE